MADLIARQFIPRSGDSLDFGIIGPEAAKHGVTPAPVRLQHGYPGAKGFGARHIETYPDRMKQIKGLGFSGLHAYVCAVCDNYTKVCRSKDGRLTLIYRYLGYDLRIVVQFTAEPEPCWTVVTGLPYRVCRDNVLYEVERKGGSEPTPSDPRRPRFAILSLPKG